MSNVVKLDPDVVGSVLHEGVTIEVTNRYQFRVGERIHDSLREAREFINENKARDVMQKRLAARVRLSALDVTGADVVVKGVHASQNKLLVEGSKIEDPEVYPQVTWIKALLTERGQLAKRITEIDGKTRRYRVMNSRGYGRVNAEHMPEIVEKVERELASLTELALKEVPT